jgi:hypothetical protein
MAMFNKVDSLLMLFWLPLKKIPDDGWRSFATRAKNTSPAWFCIALWPYKETSLIVEIFTRDYGRIALVAKGAKRPHSQLRSVLQTFQPLQLGWTGSPKSGYLPGLTGSVVCFRLNDQRYCAGFTSMSCWSNFWCVMSHIRHCLNNM